MFKCQLNGIKAVSRSISYTLRKPVPSILSRRVLVLSPNLNKIVSFGPHSQQNMELKCLFSSTALESARARFRTTQKETPPAPHPPEPEPAPEYHDPPDDLPSNGSGEKEPGSGLVKIFLAITAPILLLSVSGDFVRMTVTREEVCEALGLDPTVKPGPKYYDEYIRRYKPEKVFWLDLSQKIKQNFSFCARNAAGEGESFRWWTPLTAQFNHVGILHLFLCYTSLKAFAPVLVHLYGNRVTGTIFVAGGIMAQAFVALFEKSVNPFLAMSQEKILNKVKSGLTKDEESQLRRAISFAMGSSTSLMAMGTICAIVWPTMQLNLMFIPIGIPIRAALGAFVAFDIGGMYYDYGIPIGHSGHIGGAIAGVIMYALWIRKLPTALQRRIAQAMNERGIKMR